MSDDIFPPVETVWILGAGFSQPLGGPLLTDLFTPRLLDEIEDPSLIGFSFVVRRVFQDGLGSGIFKNAEQFVSWVEDQSREKMVDALFRRGYGVAINMPYPGIDEVRSLTRRLVAKQCSEFLARMEAIPEALEIYQDWASSLSSEDFVISFNYDCVVERVAGVDGVFVPVSESNLHTRSPWLVKVHGSVDWQSRDAGPGLIKG